MSVKLTKNANGFMRGEFSDHRGTQCRIQESSLAEESCIWLGVAPELSDAETQEPQIKMMLLTQKMASDLIPLLRDFADYGVIKKRGIWNYFK